MRNLNVLSHPYHFAGGSCYIVECLSHFFMNFINFVFMKSIEVNKRLTAACGLYCGACRKYLSEKCRGCHENEKATWCKIRTCVREHGFHSCAECRKDVSECKIYSNLIGKIFAFLFSSDRPACIRYIREHGEQAFAEEMTKRKCQTMKRK